MLDGGLDELYRAALAAPHEPYNRIEIWSGAERVIDDLIYLTGNVSASLTSRVARTLDFSVDEGQYPVNVTDPLAPFGNEARAFRGLVFGDGSRYEWPAFRGKIDDAQLGDGGTCQVRCEDRAAEVADDGFLVPRNSDLGILATEQVKIVISEALPDATFGTFDEFPHRMPILTWEHDRASALDEIATTLGAFWYALADGSFVLRRYPWTVPANPVVTFADGDGGTVTASSVRRSRAGIYNSVTVTGERADGTPPAFGNAQDDDPNSPTYVAGPFGRRHLLRNLNTPTNAGAAAAAASQLLKRTTALTEAWTFSAPADAALELGDVIGLDVRGRTGIVQVVASISLPLDARGIMTVGCRAQVIGQLEDV